MLSAALLACALNVAPVTLDAIVRVEGSGGDPLALNVNHLRGPQPRGRSIDEAAQIARFYGARGFSVDIGLMQVNSRNLDALGLTVEQVLEPCTNVRAGGAILSAYYANATLIWGEGQGALRAALRAYNTGSFFRGDSYLARYFGRHVPALQGTMQVAAITHLPPNPFAATTEVYSRFPNPMVGVE